MIDLRTELADEIAGYLEQVEGASCDEIAGKLHRRRSDVLVVLGRDERFVQNGRYKTSRWKLAGTDSGTDNAGFGDEAAATESPPISATAGQLQSRCVSPMVHRGNNAQYLHEGVRLCIICDPAPQPPILTLEEWMRGEGGEDRRKQFEADWAMVRDGSATPEQRERFAVAVGGAP